VPTVTRLDQGLLGKIAEKTRKPIKYVREQTSRRASRSGIASEAALVLWAMDLRIGITRVLARLEPHIQAQVHSAQSSKPTSERPRPRASSEQTPDIHQLQDPFPEAIDLLLRDEQLRGRCGDLLRKKKYLDRPMREATTILESRIRQLAGITDNRKPEDLVNSALNPDPTKAILVLGTVPSDQAGLHSLCKGVVLAYRHRAHHRLSEDVGREEALKFCGFVDLLLALLAKTTKRST